MRSTRWTSGIAREANYELRDVSGAHLGQSRSHEAAVRMLQAYVAMAPEKEDTVFLAILSADGREIAREDLFDVDFL